MIKQGPTRTQQPGKKWLTVEAAKSLVKEYLCLVDDKKIHQEAINLIHHYHKRTPECHEVIVYLREKSANASAAQLKSLQSEVQSVILPIAQDQQKEENEDAKAQEKETSPEPLLQEYSDLDVKNHLTSLWEENSEIVQKGVSYLMARKTIFRTLNSPFTQSFIKNNLRQILHKNTPVLQELIKQQENTPPVPNFLPNFELENKGPKNVKTFQDMSSLSAAKVASRFNQFVLVLGIPDLPRRHSSIDDSCHPSQPISFETYDLLQRGNNTLHFVHHKANAIRPCPNLLFLRKPIRKEEDPLTKKLHAEHTLDFFARYIVNEKQAPIEFHIAGHGSKASIGSYEKRFSPEDFAELFDEIVKASQLKEDLLKKPLVFVFHTCNSAYIEGGATLEEIKEKLLNESVMGRFFQKMRELKYNLTVKAYRGFYSTLNSGAGARVSSKIDDRNATTYSANSAEFEISHNGEKPIVRLPEGKGLNFTVYFESQDFVSGVRSHRN